MSIREEDLNARVALLEDVATCGLSLVREHDLYSLQRRIAVVLAERCGATATALVVGRGDPPDVEVHHDIQGAEGPRELEWTGPWPPWKGSVDEILDVRGDTSATVRRGARGMVLDLGAYLWLPMDFGAAGAALLSLGAPADRRRYDETDLIFLNAFKAYARAALDGAVRDLAWRRERTKLDRSVSALNLLLDITRALTAAVELAGVLKLILEGAIETVQAEKASLALYDPEDEKIKITLVKGLPDPELEEAINSGRHHCLALRPGEGIAGRVFKTREPILIEDTRSDGRFFKPERSYAESILCVPMITDNEAIGVINVTNRLDRRAFDIFDLERMSMLANQAAVAVNRARLYELATTDELTGLYVRRYLLKRLGQELVRAKRYGHDVTLLMLDLDHFKDVNDTYGHAAGDRVLEAVGRLLREGTRVEVDVPGRYGGEEFLLVLPETTLEGAQVVAERIRESIEKEVIRLPDRDLRITASLGVSTYPLHAHTAEDLVDCADAALYRSKAAGRNRVVVGPGDPAGPEG